MGCANDETPLQRLRVEQWELEHGEKEVDLALAASDWPSDTTNLASQIKQWIVTNVSVTGQWDSKYWHDGIHLTITARKDGKYDVLYYARGDMDSWRNKRVARFEGGICELDKPVMEYSWVYLYKHFYMIRTYHGHGIRLASQRIIRDWVLGVKPEDVNPLVVDENMLTKTKPNNTPSDPKR